MISNLIALLTNFIINLIGWLGYWGVFGLMTAQSALIPMPSEVTMPFAGYIASTGKFNIYLVVLMGALGNLLGASLSFALGYFGKDMVVRNLIKKYGKFILVSTSDLDHSEKWFKKYGEKVVFFGRMLPVVSTFISLPAGIFNMNYPKFAFFTLVGSLVWSSILTYIGFTLGKNWDSLNVYYRKFEYVIVVFGVLLVGYYIYHKISKFKKTTNR
jgi:membrane protein DedA with SNARE-associated domain